MISTIFIGYDEREKVSYDVLVDSIKRHSSREVLEHCCLKCYREDFDETKLNILPLKHKDLREDGLFNRTWHINEYGIRSDDRDGRPFSVDFSHCRFLVPHIQTSGFAIFMDCDQLFTCDPCELDKECDRSLAVKVVKHNHVPKEVIKMDKQPQQAYPRKNWSSFILWNCEHSSHKELSLYDINHKTGTWLHGFEWLKNEEIGELPRKWNMLVGYYDDAISVSANNIHYTLGSPFMEGYEDCDLADKWWEQYGRMIYGKLNN